MKCRASSTYSTLGSAIVNAKIHSAGAWSGKGQLVPDYCARCGRWHLRWSKTK